MPRLSRNALSAARVRCAGPGNYVDGNGLMLRVRASGTRQWIQRLTIHGQRVDLGLGSAELVKLADARRVAADNRAIARTGGDPRRARVPTFEKAEAVCFAEKRESWRSHGPEKAWRRAMDRYVLPKIGAMPVDKVGSAAVYEVLRPIALAGCARARARGQHATVQMAGAAITAVLEWARIAEFRAEGSPVETVRRRLPKRAGGPKHYPALRPDFGPGALGGRRGVGADRRDELRALDEAGDAVHRADGVAAGGGSAGDMGAVRPVRPGGGGVGQARGGDEDGEAAPGAAVAPGA